MGFPEPIARAQRDEIRKKLFDLSEDVDQIIWGLRQTAPHNVHLTAGGYDRLLEYAVGAKTSLDLAISTINREKHAET